LVALLIAIPLGQAAAQFGMGMPGAPGGGFGGFGGPPQAPPQACQDLISLRNTAEKQAKAIEEASKRKATAQEACKLFKAFLATESKMIKGLQEHMTTCGVPQQVIQQAKAGHDKYTQIGNNVCEAAAQAGRPAGPSLSDALGTPLTVPENSGNRGVGTFDTLTGNALTR